MCRIEGCERHDFSRDGLCLPHLKEAWHEQYVEAVTPKRKSRKKKVESVEVLTTDDTAEVDTREE